MLFAYVRKNIFSFGYLGMSPGQGFACKIKWKPNHMSTFLVNTVSSFDFYKILILPMYVSCTSIMHHEQVSLMMLCFKDVSLALMENHPSKYCLIKLSCCTCCIKLSFLFYYFTKQETSRNVFTFSDIKVLYYHSISLTVVI